MIIPKLLMLFLPLIFLVLPYYNLSQSGHGLMRTTIQEPVISAKIGVSTEKSLNSNNKNVSDVDKNVKENNQTLSVNYHKVTKIDKPLTVDVTLRKQKEIVTKKSDIIIVYPENYKEKPLSIFQSNVEMLDTTTFAPLDKTDPTVATSVDVPSTNYQVTEKYTTTNDIVESTPYIKPKSDTTESIPTLSVKIEDIASSEIESEGSTSPIPLPTKSDNSFRPHVRFPLIVRPNLPTNETADDQPKLNERTKSTISNERYVNERRRISHLTDRPSYASHTSTSTTAKKPIMRPFAQRKPRKFFSPNQLHSYTCKSVNGYYSYSNGCDEYIECKKNKPYRNVCPDGLHFNQAATWPEFPCAYPSEVKCQQDQYIIKQESSEDCPRSYGFFPVPNGDCGHFIMCQEGSAITLSCPPGLAFNSLRSNCDWPVNVPGCNPNIFEDFICPTVRDEHSHIIYNYRYKESCTKYIACQEGRPRLLSCDPGLSFDENTQKCVSSNLITNCNN